MGNYKTNWQLTETVMPEDFNRIESNIKENNKNHTDFKTEYNKTLKDQNKKIDAKSEKSDVLLKVQYPTDRDCNSFKTLNSFFAFDTGMGDFKNTPEGTLTKGTGKVFILTNRGYSEGRIQQEFVYVFPQDRITKWVRNYNSDNEGQWGNWYKAYDEANKPTWSDVTGKPSTFTPSTHTHDDRYYTESEADGRFLGKNAKASSANVADKVEWNNVANKPSNFTPSPHTHEDRVNKVPQRLNASVDLNTVTTGGNYIVAESKNAPYTYGRLVVLQWDSNKWTTQIFYSDMRNEIYTRCSTNAEATSWSSWAKVYSEVNKPTWNDINNKPSTFAPSSHNHNDRYFTKNEADERYFRNYIGNVTDFNNATTIGRYYVFKEGGSLPNAPHTGVIYGSLEVFKHNNTELMQRFFDVNGEIYTRVKNYKGEWWKWAKTPTVEAFEGANSQASGYQKLPSGIIIQWGSTVIPFDGYRAHGFLYYPIAFKEYVHCCGNVASNDYGGFCETTGTVAGDNLSRAYAEALDVGNGNRQGHNVRFQWIAIGR